VAPETRYARSGELSVAYQLTGEGPHEVVTAGSPTTHMARAGEILVSGTVRDLVVGSELVFEERGTHQLKGVPGEWRVFALA
jgi:hypothetical protein